MILPFFVLSPPPEAIIKGIALEKKIMTMVTVMENERRGEYE